jgi:polysaccharide pyruvyl transferase WcaK-like protein
MNIADLVTVREETTKEQMAAIGVRNTVHCTADPAITLKACEEQRTDEILRQEGITDTDQPIYAICPHFFSNVDKYHVHHYEKFQDDHIDRQREILAAAADYLSDHGKVIFIPMNIDTPDSDIHVGREIREKTKKKDRITFIENQYRPKEIAGLYKRCRLVIGVRLHSLIMASAVGTPVIGINYAPKVEGFMRLSEQMDHCLNLRQAEFSQLQEIIDNYLENYDRLKTQFQEKIRVIQARAEENARMAAELLK